MADGSSIGYFPGMSRLMGEVDSPTNAQPMTSPQFGGSPEQMMAFLQSPHVQQTLQNWGINFDPSQMRQSPVLPNSIMHAHPMLGRGFTGFAEGAAATPEAPLVSGVGSGISRAMQGLMGGNEMQRQYQIRQMMAPMQAIGMQMPEQEFQRKQQLLQLLGHDLDSREQQAQAALAQKQQHDIQQGQLGVERINATRPFIGPDGSVQNYVNPHAAVPAGGQSGTEFQLEQHGPGAHPLTSLTPGPVGQAGTGGEQFQMPGATLSGAQEATQGGWEKSANQPTTQGVHDFNAAKNPQNQAKADLTNALIQAGMPEAQVEQVWAKASQAQTKADFEQALIEAGVPQAQAQLLGAKAFQARETGAAQQPKAQHNRDIQIQKETDKYNAVDQQISRDVMLINQDAKATPAQKQQAQQDATQRFAKNDAARRQALQNLGVNPGAKPGGGMAGSSAPTDLPRSVNPGATQGGAQQGGPGSQVNQNVAPEKQPW